jgi:hypothetical protein
MRARRFGRLLDIHGCSAGVSHGRFTVAEFALRLASDPAPLARMPPEELARQVEDLLASPVVLRAARFAVLQVHGWVEHDVGTTYRGWAWE